jgi:hypothetical protein
MFISAVAEPVLDVPDAIKNSAPSQSYPTWTVAARSPPLGGSRWYEIPFLEALLSDVFVKPLLTGARHAVLCIAVKRQEQSSRVIV